MAIETTQQPSMNSHSALEIFAMWVCTLLITSVPLLRGSMGFLAAFFGESLEFVFRSLFPFIVTIMAFVANGNNRKYWGSKFKSLRNLFRKK